MTETKKWKWIHFLAYAIPILIVVYILSIGPAIITMGNIVNASDASVRYENTRKFQGWINTFYAPLISVGNNNAWFGDLIQQYVDYCATIFGTHPAEYDS